MLGVLIIAVSFDIVKLIDLITGPILTVDPVEILVLSQDIQVSADDLESLRLILDKDIWEAPSLVIVIPKDDQIGTLVHLGHCNRGSTLHLQIVVLHGYIHEHSVRLHLIYLRVREGPLGFQHTLKYNRFISVL